ncbi:MAG: response regulator [Gammaproteobacteria bacterium]|nr:response regulator [Gammaproteobacteria bacterium]
MNNATSIATAIIADDETHISDHLIRLLELMWPELVVLETAQTGTKALELIQQREPDIAILDIRMPSLSGLDVACMLSPATLVVFVTAFDEYATQAFDSEAVDYLLKPVNKERLEITIRRLQHKLATKTYISPEVFGKILEQTQTKTTNYLQWLRVGTGELVELIAVDKVVYLKAGGKYCSVFTEEKEHLIRMSIAQLESRLDPQCFWRIHRGTLVNVSDIVNARRDLRGRYQLTLRRRPEKLKVSTSHGHLFKTM